MQGPNGHDIENHSNTSRPASPAASIIPLRRLEPYTAHLRDARLSVELEALRTPLPPSPVSSRPSTAYGAPNGLGTPGTPGTPGPGNSGSLAYVPEAMMAYRPVSPPANDSSASTPGLFEFSDEPSFAREAKPVPRRVFQPDMRTYGASAPRTVHVRPGCCGLCEISTAQCVGSWMCSCLTGVGTILLAGCGASLAALCS